MQENRARFFGFKVLYGGDGGIYELFFARASGGTPVLFDGGYPTCRFLVERRERRLGRNKKLVKEICKDGKLIRVRCFGEIAAWPASFQQQGAKFGILVEKPAGTFPVPELQCVGLMPAFPVNELKFQGNVFRTAPRRQDKRNIPAREWRSDGL